MDMMDPSSTATMSAPQDVPSCSTTTTLPANDAAPVNSDDMVLDGPSAVPSELHHPATSSTLKRRNTDGSHQESKRRGRAVQSLETFPEYHGYGGKICSISEGDNQPADAENLLDEDIDWDEVLQQLPAAPKNFYSSHSTGFFNNNSQPLDHAMEWMQSRSISQTKYQPFTRPAFPSPLRNKSPVEGLSNTTVLRSCFRLGSVFKEVAACLRTEQEVTFELFARVSYSSREKGSRVQHFQFIDLFEDQPPHLSGVLTRWKNDSLVEKETSRFLDDTNNKMCRCLCRPRKVKKPETNWDLEVLRIRVTDWNEVESVKSVVCYE